MDRWIDRGLRLTFFFFLPLSLSMANLEPISKWVTFSFHHETKNLASFFFLQEYQSSSFRFQMTYTLHNDEKKNLHNGNWYSFWQEKGREKNWTRALSCISVCLSDEVNFICIRQNHHQLWRDYHFHCRLENDKSTFYWSEYIYIYVKRTRQEMRQNALIADNVFGERSMHCWIA